MNTYFIFTLGCQMNYADANRLRAVLNSCELKEADEKNADLMIIVACSVKQKPIQKIWGKIRNWQKQGKKIWITGCVLPIDKKKFAKEADRIFAIEKIGEIPKWLNCHSGISKKYPVRRLRTSPSCQDSVEESIQIDKNLSWIPHQTRDDRQEARDDKKKSYLDICPENPAPHYSLPITQYLLPIMTGCNNFCSYCAVPYCRGSEKSRSLKNIINELKKALKSGEKRILLLGQNVNSYGSPNVILTPDVIPAKAGIYINNENLSWIPHQVRDDKKETQDDKPADFIKLLKKIEKLEGDFTFNFMTSHPKDLSDDLIDFLSKSKKWERSLHLPLQSGSDKILKLMNRKYNINKYLNIIENLKLKIKNLSITTDVIVGFPTENKKDFEQTLKALETIKPKQVFVSQFSPRPNTVAYKMGNDVSPKTKKERWNIINEKYNK